MGASWLAVDTLIRETEKLSEFPHAEALPSVARASAQVAGPGHGRQGLRVMKLEKLLRFADQRVDGQPRSAHSIHPWRFDPPDGPTLTFRSKEYILT